MKEAEVKEASKETPAKIDKAQKPNKKTKHDSFSTKLSRKIRKTAEKLNKNKIALAIVMLIFVGGVSIGLQYLLAFIALRIFDREFLVSPVGTTVFTAVVYAATLAIVVFLPPFIYKKWKTTREELGLRELPTWTDIGLAPIGYIVMLILTSIVTAIFSLFPWFNADQTQSTGYDYYIDGFDKIIAFIALVVIAPIIEEVIFRGWLYGKLRKKFIMPVAILLVSILFGVVHLQWNVGVNVFATSVVLCLMREVTGTVYSGILLHMLKNGIAFFLLYVLNVGF